jgi:hypothetical protein
MSPAPRPRPGIMSAPGSPASESETARSSDSLRLFGGHIESGGSLRMESRCGPRLVRAEALDNSTGVAQRGVRRAGRLLSPARNRPRIRMADLVRAESTWGGSARERASFRTPKLYCCIRRCQPTTRLQSLYWSAKRLGWRNVVQEKIVAKSERSATEGLEI